MACINMFNPDHQGMIGPRISFSNDFAVDAATGRPAVKYERAPAAAAGNSPDFEFSVGSHGMIAADELFFKGRLMPLREQSTVAHIRRTTLREEMQVARDVADDVLTFSPAPSTSSRMPNRMGLRWKALMGLKKAKHEKKQHEIVHQEKPEDKEVDEVLGNVSFLSR